MYEIYNIFSNPRVCVSTSDSHSTIYDLHVVKDTSTDGDFHFELYGRFIFISHIDIIDRYMFVMMTIVWAELPLTVIARNCARERRGNIAISHVSFFIFFNEKSDTSCLCRFLLCTFSRRMHAIVELLSTEFYLFVY